SGAASLSAKRVSGAAALPHLRARRARTRRARRRRRGRSAAGWLTQFRSHLVGWVERQRNPSLARPRSLDRTARRLYLWCRWPDGHDSAMIAQRCMEEKVVFAPGNVLSASQSATSFLRFDVAQLSDKRIFAR